MPRIEQPGPTVRQVSGNEPSVAPAPILSVLFRRTYRVEKDGRLALAAEQLPLVDEPVDHADGSDRIAADADLFPLKPVTDLVLLGHAHGKGRKQFDVSIHVNGKPVKSIRVIGNREVGSLGDGEIFIAPPAPVDKVPLTYTHAYGGIDKAALVKHGNPWKPLAEYYKVDPNGGNLMNPFHYPRNPAGRGYMLEATVEAVNTLVLPNLEDPLDLLTPQRLPFRQPGWWYKQPLPQATEWFPHTWFPRVGYLGLEFGVFGELGKVAEVDRGFCPPEVMHARMPTPQDAFRFTCGASLGLQLPHFRGGEVVTIDNAHPTESRFTIRIPTERPRIWVDGRKGTMKETEPVIQTVLIEPDSNHVSLVWRGAAQALRQYLPQELEKMPLKVEW